MSDAQRAAGSEKKKRVVIVGAGASGVFTAFLLERYAPGRFDIAILERQAHAGGHAHSVIETVDGQSVSIDLGAQFFSEEAQPDYCELLREEGLFDVPGLITQHDVGMTVWHQSRNELLFKLPNSLGRIVGAALRDPITWSCFAWFVGSACRFWKTDDWSTTFDTWLVALRFPFVSAATSLRFKRDVVRPLMYQFGLVAPDRLGDLSARFVLFYFLASLPKRPDLTPLTIYNCSEGLDGIHERLLDRSGLRPHLVTSATVEAIAHAGDHHVVTTSGGEGRYEADELVLSMNPPRALGLLSDDDDNRELRSVLGAMEYVDVPIRIQHPTSSYMPDDEDAWSVSNVIVTDTDRDLDADHYMLTVWFGAVRDVPIGRRFFKSWGSPDFQPPDAPIHRRHFHRLMVGTPAFIAARDRLRKHHQGKRGLWFVGGYSIDYDTQNSALRSAHLVAERIVRESGAAVPREKIRFIAKSGHEVDA